MPKIAVAAWTSAFILAFACPRSAEACKRLVTSHRVGDHFDVVVGDRERAAVGIEVVLQPVDASARENGFSVEETTGATGTASFRNLRPGSYHLYTAHFAGNESSHDVTVVKGEGKVLEEKITLSWPSHSVLVTKDLRGTLVSLGDDEERSVPLPRIGMTLMEGYSGRVVGKFMTDSDGSFAFGGLPPGLYFLTLSEEGGGWDAHRRGFHLQGDIPIEINPVSAGALGSIPLRIAMSDCGLMYRVEQ